MIKNKQDLHLYIKEDAKRNNIKSIGVNYYKSLLEGSESAHAFKYLKTLRYCEYYYNTKKDRLFSRLMFKLYYIKLKRLGLKLSIQIPLNVCGYGLRIIHLSGGGGIVLNAKKIGNYCGVNSGVVIGENGSKNDRATIGDFVLFGPGSKCIGKVSIGNNVCVAANAVVTKDIADNTTVGGIPAKAIKDSSHVKEAITTKFNLSEI